MKNTTEYFAIWTDANGDTLHTATLQAASVSQAHTLAADLHNDGSTLCVYANTDTVDGILRGAIQVANTTAKHAIERTGGTDTQRRIAAELGIISHSVTTANTATLSVLLGETSADTQDFVGYAWQGLLDGKARGASIAEQYGNAYKALNDFIASQRTANKQEQSLEFVTESGGDIVSISQYVGRILSGGERYTPSESPANIMDNETAQRLGDVLAEAAKLYTPRQRHIIQLVTVGYSVRQIAAKLGIKHPQTVQDHINNVRAKTTAYIADNAPDFLDLIRAAEVNAVAQQRNKSRHTSKADRHKGGQAAYMRAYRARKRAERK